MNWNPTENCACLLRARIKQNETKTNHILTMFLNVEWRCCISELCISFHCTLFDNVFWITIMKPPQLSKKCALYILCKLIYSILFSSILDQIYFDLKWTLSSKYLSCIFWNDILLKLTIVKRLSPRFKLIISCDSSYTTSFYCQKSPCPLCFHSKGTTNSSSTRPYQVNFSTKIVHLHVVTTRPHGTIINTDLKHNVPMGPRSHVVDLPLKDIV